MSTGKLIPILLAPAAALVVLCSLSGDGRAAQVPLSLPDVDISVDEIVATHPRWDIAVHPVPGPGGSNEPER